MTSCQLAIRLIAALLVSGAWLGGAETLDFYVIDVGQANATFIVAPTGETMLYDAGPRRTADRVLAVMKEAGVKQLDYVMVSHFHEDHFGGVLEIAPKIKIRNFMDHGPSVESGQSEEWWRKLKGDQYRDGMGKAYDELYAEYNKTIQSGNHIVVKAGDLKAADASPLQGIEALAVCAAGKMMAKPLDGAGKPNPACANTELRLDDYEEDGQSIGLLLTYGKFRFIELGDLTWNLSYRFFCPNNPIGTVDAYVITHHARSYPKTAGEMSWSLSSCPKAEVHGLRPRVAIGSIGSGAPIRRADALEAVRTSPGLEDLWQTNFVRAGPEKEFNAPEQFIANLGGRSGRPLFIKISARADGSFTVTNSRNGFTKRYAPRAELP
jgi:hypothetical protein